MVNETSHLRRDRILQAVSCAYTTGPGNWAAATRLVRAVGGVDISVFTSPTIASEVARHRHRDFVARADRYRLSHCVHHPSTLSVWRHFRAPLRATAC